MHSLGASDVLDIFKVRAVFLRPYLTTLSRLLDACVNRPLLARDRHGEHVQLLIRRLFERM
eukprot:COSAG04_NODE_28395_length_276_cov_0.576271_1_plen_60_part_10